MADPELRAQLIALIDKEIESVDGERFPILLDSLHAFRKAVEGGNAGSQELNGYIDKLIEWQYPTKTPLG